MVGTRGKQSSRSATATPAGAPTLRERLSAFWPLSGGPQEIRALDGLRAVAALSVLFYHSFRSVTDHVTFLGHDVTFLWNYGQTGVDLFFVLSGFLLFLPYARALLQARPWPSAKQFYRRRALRILPAYWTCLAVLALINLRAYLSPTGLLNFATHLVLIHDDFPAFNRAFENPFWTLAIEWQFYLVLPLIALGIRRLAGSAPSLRRVVAGVLLVMAGALALREVDAAVQARMVLTHGIATTLGMVFLRVTMGSQGKFLEVFAAGMLASTLYVAASQAGAAVARSARRLGVLLFACGLLSAIGLALWINGTSLEAPPFFIVNRPRDLATICAPWLIGLSYAAVLLGILWGNGLVRAVFEWRPLRFIGLISFSLYLWHGPIIYGAQPLTTRLPTPLGIMAALGVGFLVAVPFAYASYQWVERPFLARRQSAATRVAPAPGMVAR